MRHGRFGLVRHLLDFVCREEVKLTVCVEYIDREGILIFSHTRDNFAASCCHLNGNVALLRRSWLRQRIPYLRQRELRANAREVWSKQPALSSDHVTGCAFALALINFHAVLNI